ncbi:hypothetical protein H4I96_01964 [Botrytis cinerea]
MVHHTRGSAIAAFLTRNHRPITFSRSIHNVKLVGLHNQLFQPDPEMIRFDGLRLHGPTDKMVTHPGCIEPARAIASELLAIQTLLAQNSKKIETPTILVASVTVLIAESPAEIPLLSKATFGELIAALGDAIESLTWVHSGRPRKSTKLPKDTENTIGGGEEVL